MCKKPPNSTTHVSFGVRAGVPHLLPLDLLECQSSSLASNNLAHRQPLVVLKAGRQAGRQAGRRDTSRRQQHTNDVLMRRNRATQDVLHAGYAQAGGDKRGC